MAAAFATLKGKNWLGPKKMTLIGATPIAQVSARPDQVHLRLLATSDLHAHLLPYDYFTARRASGIGLARLSDLIAQAREDAPNSMLFDNGDTLQGTPLADTTLVRILPSGGTNPMITAMNALGFDAGTLGNHDFDFGLDYLETSLDAADFPVTLANVHRPDGAPFQAPRLMLKRAVSDGAGGTHTLRVGVTGALPPQVAAWSRRIVEGRLVFEDITTTVAAQVAALRADGADIVVVLAHSGLGHAAPAHGAENVARHLATLDGVDAIVAGHTHDLAALEAGPGFAPVVQPAAYGTHLGVIDMVLDPPNGANHWAVDVSQAANLATPVRPRRQGGALRRLLGRFPALRHEVAHAHRTTQMMPVRT